MDKVKIINYKDSEIIREPLVVLKGVIGSSVAGTSNRVYTSDTFSITSTSSGRIEKGSVLLTKNSFSSLLMLGHGQNRIRAYYKENGEEVEIEIFPSNFHINYEILTNRPYSVMPVYVTLYGNNEVDPKLINRGTLGLQLVQWYFSECIRNYCYGRQSFGLSNRGGSLKLDLSLQKLMELSPKQVWELLGRELRKDQNLWNENLKYIAFLAFPWSQETNGISPLDTGLGGGGLALVNADILHVWPDKYQDIFDQLNNDTPVASDIRTLSIFHSSTGRLFGASLGEVAHELAHVFDLGHTQKGMMGKDFHRFQLCLLPPVMHSTVAAGYKFVPNKVYLPNGQIAEDCTGLPISCAALLNYNRWFQIPPIIQDQPTPTASRIEIFKHIVKSCAGLTAIEIRDPENGLILYSWTSNRKKTVSFMLGKRFIPQSYSNIPLDLVVQDEEGSLCKTHISRVHLPETVTFIRRSMF